MPCDKVIKFQPMNWLLVDMKTNGIDQILMHRCLKYAWPLSLTHVYFLTCTYQHQHIGKLGQLEYLISSSILTHHKKNVLIMLFFINHKIIFPTNKILTVEFSSWLVNRGSEWWWHFPPRSIRSLEKRKISCNDRLIIIIFIKWIQL